MRGFWADWAAAGALALVGMGIVPATGQDDPVARAEALARQLDFPAALAVIDSALATAPGSAPLLLARAQMHRAMRRPGLAIADLTSALAATPNDPALLAARGAIYAEAGDADAARADLETALRLAPGNAALTRARAALGLAPQTAPQTAPVPAAAPAPDTPADTPAAATLVAAAESTGRAPAAEPQAANAPAPLPPPPGVSYDPAALMDPAFRVVEGAASAPSELVILHGAADLAREAALLDQPALERALDAGQLRVVNLFTYSGQDSSIWGALAMLCAGPVAQRPVAAALSGSAAQAAFAALDSGADDAPLRAVVAAAYHAAGLDPALVDGCAFDRGFALRYVADWGEKYRSTGWDGGNFYDVWPLFVLNGTPVSPEALNARLALWAPAPAAPPEPAADAPGEPTVEAPADALALPPDDAAPALVAPPAPPAAAAPDTAMQPAEIAEAVPEAEPPVAITPAAPAPALTALPADLVALPRFAPQRPVGGSSARLAADLKGVWAPTLAGCLAYLDAIEAPTGLDQALPGLNPLDGPALGTVLITSQGVVLFNAAATACAPVSGSAASRGDTAQLTCHNRIDPSRAAPMRLDRIAPAGSTPRLAAQFGVAEPVELGQCLTLGQLSTRFADLWQVDSATCTASAPLAAATLGFGSDGAGGLTLTVTPGTAPARPGTLALTASVDGVALADGPAVWDGGGWTLPLGPQAEAARALSLGMFFTLAGAPDAPPLALELPLLGSGAAMKALAACAGG